MWLLVLLLAKAVVTQGHSLRDGSSLEKQVQRDIDELAGAQHDAGVIDLGSATPCVQAQTRYPCVHKYVHPVITAVAKGDKALAAEKIAIAKRDKLTARHRLLRKRRAFRKKRERKHARVEIARKKVVAKTERRQQNAALAAMQHEAIKYTRLAADQKARIVTMRTQLDSLHIEANAATNPRRSQREKDAAARLTIDIDKKTKASKDASREAAAAMGRAKLMRQQMNNERAEKQHVFEQNEQKRMSKLKPDSEPTALQQPPSKFMTALKAREQRRGAHVATRTTTNVTIFEDRRREKSG